MNLNFLKNLLLKGKLTVEGSAEIGISNQAIGERSFAQGLEVTASGASSHAEGYSTTASGLNSHAEGVETDATGASSHTEGNSTLASGDNTHAEGYLTAATGLGSHAEGDRTATGKRINYNTYTGSTQVFTFTPDTSAEFNYVTPGTVLRGYDSDVLSDYFTFTVLDRSTVTGNITAVESTIGGNSNNGFIINNSGEYAHVEGFESIASGFYSHAEGDYTEASGESSHAEGASTIASGDYSHAEGGSTIASGNYSHAEGSFTEAKGSRSHAAGFGATAGHNYSYVWSDGELGTREPNLSSTREGQYVIDAIGGVYIPRNVGIGTDSIDNALTVVGTVSTSQHGSSNQWNTAFTLVQNNSASWEESADILPTVTNYLSTSNVLVSGLSVTGNISATGNISGQNIIDLNTVNNIVRSVSSPRRFTYYMSDFVWTETGVNGATFSSIPMSRALATNTNPAASAIRFVGTYGPQFWSPPGSPSSGFNAGINWSKQTELRFSFLCNGFTGNHQGCFRFGTPRLGAQFGAYTTLKGVGLLMGTAGISGFLSNGTSTFIQYLTSFDNFRYEAAIIHNPLIATDFYINDNLTWSAPITTTYLTGWSGQESTQLAYMIGNFGETTNSIFALYPVHFTMEN